MDCRVADLKKSSSHFVGLGTPFFVVKYDGRFWRGSFEIFQTPFWPSVEKLRDSGKRRRYFCEFMYTTDCRNLRTWEFTQSIPLSNSRCNVSDIPESAFLISIGVSAELSKTLDIIANASSLSRLALQCEADYFSTVDKLKPGVVVSEVTGDQLMSLGNQCAEAGRPQDELVTCQSRILIADNPTIDLTVNAIRTGFINVLCLSQLGIEAELQATLQLAVKKALAESYRLSLLARSTTAVRISIDSLSVGELQVLYFVLEGSLNKRIATNLQISERTVESRRKRIFEKTGTASVAKLVRLIVETVGAEEIARRCEHLGSVTPPPHFKTEKPTENNHEPHSDSSTFEV